MFKNSIATCFKDNIILFIILAISNKLFVLENITFYAKDYKDYN
jgi:hypothetical protein